MVARLIDIVPMSMAKAFVQKSYVNKYNLNIIPSVLLLVRKVHLQFSVTTSEQMAISIKFLHQTMLLTQWLAKKLKPQWYHYNQTKLRPGITPLLNSPILSLKEKYPHGCPPDCGSCFAPWLLQVVSSLCRGLTPSDGVADFGHVNLCSQKCPLRSQSPYYVSKLDSHTELRTVFEHRWRYRRCTNAQTYSASPDISK